MEIETVEDLANKIADMIGVYGACKSEGNEDGCEFSEKNIACCRVGFCMEMEERIRQSVKNDEMIHPDLFYESMKTDESRTSRI